MMILRSLLAVLLLTGSASARSTQIVPPRTTQLSVDTVPGSSAQVEVFVPEPVKEVRTKRVIHLSRKVAITSGLVLAFNSGYSNGCCLAGSIVEGTKQAVAAVTGAWTTSALGYATGNMDQFKTAMTMLLSYAGGSCIAGIMNPSPTPFQLSSSIGPALLMCAALMTMSTMLVTNNGGALAIFSLAAIANGIQNSITSVHTGNLVRSAHYSGMTSDMGTFLGQLLRGNSNNKSRLKVCASLAAAFWSGGFVSVYAVKQFGTSALMLSALLYAVSALATFAYEKSRSEASEAI